MRSASSAVTWSRPPSVMEITSTQVDIWRVHLNLSADSLATHAKTLSSEESERAARFHFDKDRNRFITAHGCLREILTCYLPLEPAQFNFSVNAYGKPSLSDPPAEQRLEFNLSHSQEFALVAIVRNHQVGVDIEHIRPDPSMQGIAQRFFSGNEIAELHALPREKRQSAFFICWTRKEAYIKAHGLGLSLPLDSFDVSLTPGQPAILRATRPDREEASRWSLKSLEVHPDYAAAVAVQGHDLEFRLWDWNLY